MRSLPLALALAALVLPPALAAGAAASSVAVELGPGYSVVVRNDNTTASFNAAWNATLRVDPGPTGPAILVNHTAGPATGGAVVVPPDYVTVTQTRTVTETRTATVTVTETRTGTVTETRVATVTVPEPGGGEGGGGRGVSSALLGLGVFAAGVLALLLLAGGRR